MPDLMVFNFQYLFHPLSPFLSPTKLQIRPFGLTIREVSSNCKLVLVFIKNFYTVTIF